MESKTDGKSSLTSEELAAIEDEDVLNKMVSELQVASANQSLHITSMQRKSSERIVVLFPFLPSCVF